MQALRLAGALCLLLCALAALGARQWQQSQIPPTEDWSRAASQARASWQEGDAFRVLPAWDSRPRVFLKDKDYIPAAQARWPDVDPYKRVWALVERGREAQALETMPPSWRQEGEGRPFGAVSLLLLVQDRAPGGWDVFGALPEASVRRLYQDRSQACTDFSAQSWHCRPRDRWLYVGESTQLVTNEAHRCLWAMPIDKGGVLEISFEGLPGGRLEGFYGQTLEAVRSSRGKPVRFAVAVGEQERWSQTLGISDEGWRPFSLDVEAGARVRFLVQSDDKLDRFFCFAARVVEPEAH